MYYGIVTMSYIDDADDHDTLRHVVIVLIATKRHKGIEHSSIAKNLA